MRALTPAVRDGVGLALVTSPLTLRILTLFCFFCVAVGVRDASAHPAWSSFLLALGRDVAVRMAHAGGSSMEAPAQPNVLQLHRATLTDWPQANLDGTPLPAPTLYGEPAATRRGARIFLREQYAWLFAECELARDEHTTEFGGAARSQGAVIQGDSGVGKS